MSRCTHIFFLPALVLLVGAPSLFGTPLFTSIELGAADGFTLLSLKNGIMTINSATSITGDVGYSEGVTSTTNQKVGSFTGTAYVDSTATFSDTPATFVPSGGIVVGGPADTLLAQANSDVSAAVTLFSGLSPTSSLAAVTGNLNLTSTGDVNVFSVTSVNVNAATWTLTGSATDFFLFVVSGDFGFSQSQIVLNGVSPEQVVFYFPNPSNIEVQKDTSVFAGTILAPTGSVIYHNPAIFDGRIIAENIDVHSDFNIDVPGGGTTQSTPEPSGFAMLGGGLALLCARVTRAKRNLQVAFIILVAERFSRGKCG